MALDPQRQRSGHLQNWHDRCGFVGNVVGLGRAEHVACHGGVQMGVRSNWSCRTGRIDSGSEIAAQDRQGTDIRRTADEHLMEEQEALDLAADWADISQGLRKDLGQQLHSQWIKPIQLGTLLQGHRHARSVPADRIFGQLGGGPFRRPAFAGLEDCPSRCAPCPDLGPSRAAASCPNCALAADGRPPRRQ